MKLLNNITKGMRWAVVLLLMALPLSLFGQVEVSLPDTALKAGETIEVPIYVSNMNEADGVVSGEFEFNFNESYFDITGFNKTGTILESVGSVLYFEGTDRLAFASTDTVSGEGVLVKLLVKGNDDADYFRNSNLTFTSAKLNEGDPAITTTDGSLRILGVRISPKSNIQITNGDTLQFSLQEDVTNPVSWTVTDTNIASIDTNGQLIAKTTGTVQVKGVDAEGLKDSTSFFTILPNVFTDFTVSMPDTSTTQTLYLDLPIRTSEVTGLGITSAEFDISFSSNYFSLEEVLSGPLTSVWSSLTVNIDDNRVRIAGAGTDSLEGSGDLYILRFKVTDNNSGNSTISFNSGIFNEDLSSDLENATVYVNNAPDINVFPSDTAVSIGNSLSFEVTGGNGTAPYTWESSNAGIGDIDASTGVLTGISRGDIIVNARDAENFPSDLVNVRVNDFDAYLDSLELNYPDTVVLGLYTNELSSYSVYSYETEFRYDTTRLEFLGTDVTNTQTESAGLSTEVRDSLNYIRIAAAGTSALSGNDPIIKFRFAPKNAVAHGDSLKIDLRYLNFNEPSPTVPTTTAIPGLITIQRINPPGAITLSSPSDNFSEADTSITFEWVEDAEADEYRIQLSTDDQFSTTLYHEVVSQSMIQLGSLDFSTTYYWRVLGINQGGEGAWSDVYSFTTFDGLPAIVSLLSPQDGESEVEINTDLTWNSAALADEYVLQLSTESDFSTFVKDSSAIADTSISVALDYETQYFWRVQAMNAQGDSPDWSQTFDFTTKEKVNQPPAIVNPLGAITLDEDFGKATAAVFDSVFSDPEGEALTYEIIEFDSSLFTASLNVDTLILSSLQDEYGSGMVVVKATDIENGEIMDTLLVEITSVNDLPEFTQIPDTLKFRNDEDFTLQLDTSITDVEDLLDDFTIEAEADPADIGVSYDADNYIVTLSSPGFSGEGTLTITVTDSDGGEVSVSIVVVVELSTSNELAGDIPDHFDLLQNYPNPFNPATQIRFDLPEATEVKIEVFSMLGQKVTTLANKRFTAGKHRVQFEAGALSSGMYIYRIQAGDFVKTKKMTLIK